MTDGTKEDLTAKITITYSSKNPTIGKGSNDFNSLQDLKKWLDKHLMIAEKLGYTKKK